MFPSDTDISAVATRAQNMEKQRRVSSSEEALSRCLLVCVEYEVPAGWFVPVFVLLWYFLSGRHIPHEEANLLPAGAPPGEEVREEGKKHWDVRAIVPESTWHHGPQNLLDNLD